jgi:hypothetical protein
MDALAAPMAPAIAQEALAALGLSSDPVHEPVHARRPYGPDILLLCVTSLNATVPAGAGAGKNVHDTAWAERAAAEAKVEVSLRRLREQENRPGKQRRELSAYCR